MPLHHASPPPVSSWNFNFRSTARNVATFGNTGGEYDDLAAYLKKRKLL